jgi:hypothetical protein
MFCIEAANALSAGLAAVFIGIFMPFVPQLGGFATMTRPRS